MTDEFTRQGRIAVVGGGLAGLTAAAFLARAGRRVTIFERSSHPGGRARSLEAEGFRLNMGPHALYLGDADARILRELGVRYSGKPPQADTGLLKGKLHPLPATPLALLRTGLLGLREKIEAARVLPKLLKIDPAGLRYTTLEEWIESTARTPGVRELIRALARVSTYANAPGLQSAQTAIAQIQLAANQGVLYLDGGWQTLVDGLLEIAVNAGAQVVTDARVRSIEQDGRVRGLRLEDGRTFTADVVILAVSPQGAGAMVDAPGATELREWASTTYAVRAACLDLGLRRLPRPDLPFALGIDRPLYFSVHSAWARLGPEGGAAVHAAIYLDPLEERDPSEVRQELEEMLDTLQPGWRELVVTERYLPRITVAPVLDTAEMGGSMGRPACTALGVENLYLAGDWVGSEGLLAGAAMASGRQAAMLAIRTTAGTGKTMVSSPDLKRPQTAA